MGRCLEFPWLSQRASTLQQLHARLAIEAAEQNVWMNPWVARIDSLAASSIGDIAHNIAFQKHRMVSWRCCCGHCDCGIARPGTTAGTPRTPVSANGGTATVRDNLVTARAGRCGSRYSRLSTRRRRWLPPTAVNH